MIWSTVTSMSDKPSRNIAKNALTPWIPLGSPGGVLWLTKLGAKNASTTASKSADSNSARCRRPITSELSEGSMPHDLTMDSGCASDVRGTDGSLDIGRLLGLVRESGA